MAAHAQTGFRCEWIFNQANAELASADQQLSPLLGMRVAKSNKTEIERLMDTEIYYYLLGYSNKLNPLALDNVSFAFIADIKATTPSLIRSVLDGRLHQDLIDSILLRREEIIRGLPQAPISRR